MLPKNNLNSRILSVGLLALSLLVSGCATHKTTSPVDASIPPDFHIKDSAPRIQFDPKDIAPVIPEWEPYSQYGNRPSYQVLGKTYHVLSNPGHFKQQGIASWYGTKFHGRRTSSWEFYDMFAMTAAHKTLPLPSYVKVTNLENKRSAIVRVNDRGPFHDGRIIDLSYAAAHVLGVADKGTAPVEIELISPAKTRQIPVKKTAQATLPAHLNPSNTTKPAVAASGTEQLYLQVGAFSALDSAQNLQTKLMAIINHPVSISPIATKPNGLLRVMVGPFQQAEEMDQISALIQSHQLGNPLVKTW